MSRPHTISVPETSVLALEANAACAGMALGCAYASSDEYESELISARRAAGAYGPRWRHRLIPIAFVAAAAAIIVAALIA